MSGPSVVRSRNLDDQRSGHVRQLMNRQEWIDVVRKVALRSNWVV